MWSSANQGELVKLNCYRTGKEEAQGISDIIEQKQKKYSLNDVSILVRAIYQTREFRRKISSSWNWVSCLRWNKIL